MIGLQSIYKDKIYHFNPFLGCLISKSYKGKVNHNPTLSSTLKVKKALEIIHNPFIIGSYRKENNIIKIGKFINYYAHLLIWCYHNFYPGLYLLSKLRLNHFSNSTEAIKVFCKIHPKNQNQLCFPRSIFAVTTSKRFKKHGVLFIGVFHPSRHMHAWVIEDGVNAYQYDNIWTNFTPVALIK